MFQCSKCQISLVAVSTFLYVSTHNAWNVMFFCKLTILFLENKIEYCPWTYSFVPFFSYEIWNIQTTACSLSHFKVAIYCESRVTLEYAGVWHWTKSYVNHIKKPRHSISVTSDLGMVSLKHLHKKQSYATIWDLN